MRCQHFLFLMLCFNNVPSVELQVWVTQSSYSPIVWVCGWQVHAFVIEYQRLTQQDALKHIRLRITIRSQLCDRHGLSLIGLKMGTIVLRRCLSLHEFHNVSRNPLVWIVCSMKAAKSEVLKYVPTLSVVYLSDCWQERGCVTELDAFQWCASRSLFVKII